MKLFLFFCRRKLNNKGITLLELIIAMTIMAVLVGAIIPQYVKFVNKSRKSTDLENAETIAKAFERVLINNPEFYELYTTTKANPINVVDDWGRTTNKNKKVPPQVAGEKGYKIYSLISSENFGIFSGNAFKGNPRNSEGQDIYEALNEELGISYADTNTVQKWQREGRGKINNDIMVPRYKIKPDFDERRSYVDRWRICKREDGQLEIWTAENSVSGDGGGYPCYRLWPVPCDAYAE